MMATRDASPDNSQPSTPPIQPQKIKKQLRDFKETPKYKARMSLFHKAADSPEARARNNNFKKLLQEGIEEETEEEAFRIEEEEEEEEEMDYSKLSLPYSGSDTEESDIDFESDEADINYERLEVNLNMDMSGEEEDDKDLRLDQFEDRMEELSV